MRTQAILEITPWHKKYSQSEYEKAVVFPTVLNPTFSCAACICTLIVFVPVYGVFKKKCYATPSRDIPRIIYLSLIFLVYACWNTLLYIHLAVNCFDGYSQYGSFFVHIQLA